ncbi:MAG: alpha-L-fucosidase [Ruminococcaceae bacterium]|nr:alpha-L-fucosidase [Oscillospiraceae bacterium]
MSVILSKSEYEEQIAASRDRRMAWWREARFGMFVHFGLYSQVGRNEWLQALESIPVEEYEKLADSFAPKPGAPREWAMLAKAAGMKYMVLTTRHHEGFSLWDSKVNPYNSVNYGPHRDIVKEFVDACREFDLKIGFYSSLMDWHHPDGWRCAVDEAARCRFLDYIEALNTELLTNYGKIDILWYDVSQPLQSWEGWNSLARNQRLRELQPDIIINDRSRLAEDFGTPEEHVTASERDWEACMTFNGISWGYLDEEQVRGYSYNAPRILKMLNTCCKGGGNLLLNIGPKPDGSVPSDAVTPLTEVGEWLSRNGEVVYGRRLGKWDRFGWNGGANGISSVSCSEDGKTCYLWCWIWPKGGSMAIGGYFDAPRKVSILSTGEEIRFSHDGHRIILEGLPEKCPDPSGIAVIKLEFNDVPEYHSYGRYPQMNEGRQYKTKNKR